MSTKAEKRGNLILRDKPIWKGIVILAFPVFLANIFKTLHDLVDAYFLGQLGDSTIATDMQGAIGLTWPIFFVFMSFGMGLSVAGNALVGQYIGKGDYESARKYATNVVYLSIALGVIFTIISYVMAPYILGWMGVEGNKLEYAITYLRIRSFELTILFVTFAFQAIRRATGDTTTPVIVSSIAILINIILTPLFVLQLDMGIEGAALATLIAQAALLPVTILLLIRNSKGISVHFNVKHINVPIIKDIFRIALPASSGQSIQAVGFIILQAFIETFDVAVTAFYLGNRINSLIMFPVSSISAIVAVYVAQNIGAGNIKRAKESVKQGIFMSVGLMIVGVLLILPFRRGLVSLFSDDTEAISMAVEYMFYVALSLPLVAIFQNFLSTFQGSGDTKFSFALALIRLWLFRLPLVYIFINYTNLGPTGIWYAMLISNILAVMVGSFLYTRVKFTPKIRLSKSS
ncbi:MAG: MATE family efflux transporter [Sphaerochaetaceae bacterium]|nr:MATE family efflux transporter [Sphaerochaetaceae bacterium]